MRKEDSHPPSSPQNPLVEGVPAPWERREGLTRADGGCAKQICHLHFTIKLDILEKQTKKKMLLSQTCKQI